MAATQQGTMAILFGLPDVGTVTLGASTQIQAAIVISDISLTPTAQEIRAPDENGNTVNITTWDQGMEVTLTCKPRGTSSASAGAGTAALANSYFPAIGTLCTILQAGTTPTRFNDDGYSRATTGWSYRVKAATKNMVASQQVTWNLTLERLDSISSMTPIT